MLVCLPFIGAVVGGLWALLAWGLSWIPGLLPLKALALAAFPWLVTGFLHLDGFMDVSDAILSRRDLATRQKILKDSTCGAFAVISVALLFLYQWAVFLSMDSVPLVPLFLIPVVVRAGAAFAVMSFRSMGTSQYAKMSRKIGGKQIFLLILAAALCILGPVLSGISGFALCFALLGYSLAAFHGFRQLDGMSGDISGYAISLGEFSGVLALCILEVFA